MYLFTHLAISKTLYRKFSKEIPLSRRAFSYGNMKPDLTFTFLNRHHTLANYLFIVNEYANKLIHDELSIKEFSVRLGEICHFVCDFFCYYHLNEKLYNKMLHHGFYELKMYIKLLRIRIKNNFKVPANKNMPQKNITSIIMQLRKEYFSNPRNTQKDLDYALNTAVWICESIFDAMKYFAGIKSFGDVNQSFFAEAGKV